MKFFGQIFLLIALLALLIGGFLGYDAWITVSEGTLSEATVIEVKTERVRNTSGDGPKYRTRHIYLTRHQAPDGSTVHGEVGHRFSTPPQKRKAGGGSAFGSGGKLRVSLSFSSFKRGDTFKGYVHPDNPYFIAPVLDVWMLPEICAGVVLLFGILGIVCFVTAPKDEGLDAY